MLLLATILSTIGYTTAVWRASMQLEPNHHYIVKPDSRINYVFGHEHLILKQELNLENSSWLYPEECTITYVNFNVSSVNCPHNGKHNIGLQKSCVGCLNDHIVVRFNEVPQCYFWYVKMEKLGSVYNIQIRIDTIGKLDAHKSELLTKLFHSRGEKPVFKSIVDNPYTTAQPGYNASTFTWFVNVPASVATTFPYLLIESTQHIPIAGCFIAPVVFHIRHFDQQFLIRQVPLLAKPTNNRQVHYHSCFPEKSIFLTQNGAFLTNDNFHTNTQMFISQLHANQFSNLIDAAAVSPDYLYVVLSGTIFRAKLSEENLLFQKQTVNNLVNAHFLGVSTMPGCLFSIALKNFVSWENTYVATWNQSNIFITNTLKSNWTVFGLPIAYSESSIVDVQLGRIPGDIAVLIEMLSTLKVLFCSYLTVGRSLDNCTAVILPFQPKPTETLSFEFLNSAFSSLLLWTPSSVGYSYNNGAETGNFSEVQSTKTIAFSNDHGKYLIQDSENRLFYGSGKCRKLLRLRQVDPPNENVFYKFQFIGNRLTRIEWRIDGTLSVQREIFPLESEVYAMMQSTSNESICDVLKFLSNFPKFKGNVRNLESMTDTIQVEFTLIYLSSYPVDLRFTHNFGNIVVMQELAETMYTHVHHDNTSVRVKTIKAELSGSCGNTSTSCTTGLAALEVEAIPLHHNTICMLPSTKLLFINATCPVGLHIRIQNSSGDSCGTYESDSDCMETIINGWMFEPLVELYSFDERLYTIKHDILLREVNNKTGFELHDKNILKKDCYLCSQFRQSNLSHELYLQIPESACPCQMEKYGNTKWISKLTFEEVMPTPGSSEEFVFEVIVLGNSFCRLSTRFTVKLEKSPMVTFAVWEYIVVSVFITLSIVVFAISYYNYMKFMREAKAKLS